MSWGVNVFSELDCVMGSLLGGREARGGPALPVPRLPDTCVGPVCRVLSCSGPVPYVTDGETEACSTPILPRTTQLVKVERGPTRAWGCS